MFFELFALAAGIIVLAKSSELTVKFAERISVLTGIGKVAIGFILIAVATSLPELSIAALSSIKGEGLLSVGNILGSNIMNIALIFGIISMMAAVKISRPDYKEIKKAVFATSLLALPLIFFGGVWWAFSIVCFFGFALYLKSIMGKEFKRNRAKINGLVTVETVKVGALLAASVSVVILSSFFVTESAISIANIFGIAESLIGATIIALGTSLPDLSVAIAAVRKGDVEIAIGDGIGAIVIKMTLALGIASLASPVYFGDIVRLSAAAMVAVNVAFLALASSGRLGRKSGAVLLALFAAFLISLLFVA
jgi:cation:H+ antiporter